MAVYDKLLKDKNLSDKLIEKNKTWEYISTGVLSINVLHSGKVSGGIRKGTIDQISADSSLGKSFIGLSILKNAQKVLWSSTVMPCFAWRGKILFLLL